MKIFSNSKSISILRRLFRDYTKSQKKLIIRAIIALTLLAATGAVNAFMLKPLLDRIFIDNSSSKFIWLLPSIIMINALIRAIASFYESSSSKIISYNISTKVQVDLYDHLIYSDNSFFDDYSTGNFMSHFTNDINAMKNVSTAICITLVKDMLNLVSLGFLMFYHNPKLAIFAITIFPITAYSIIYIGQKIRHIAKKMHNEVGDFASSLNETFRNISVVKAYNREEYEVKRVGQYVQNYLELSHKAAKMEAISSPIIEMLGSIAMMCVLWYGGHEVINKTISPGTLLSFIAALFLTYRPLKSIAQSNSVIQEGVAACSRIFKIIDKKPKICDEVNSLDFVVKNGEIKFIDVSFAYKKRNFVLKNFCMEVRRGQTVAIVGHSGVGKSTIIQLLQRFYDPNSGYIEIDGVNIKNIKLFSLRDSISLVGQDIRLFDDTILENIRYGRLNATKEEVQNAAKLAAAHDFIMQMPNKYATNIGNDGCKLSGGQKQRIAIARAILKDAPILLLDEATSSLDSNSEEEVQNAINLLRKNRTTIIIAHRLSTIKNADFICCISNGAVVEQGTHEDLIGKNKIYAKFFRKYDLN